MRFLAITCETFALAVGLLAQTTASPEWHVRLADGTRADVIVTLNPAGNLEFKNDKAVVLSIPSTGITGTFHSTQRITRSKSTYNALDRHCCGATDGSLLPFLAGAIAAPLGHAKEHYVEVTWYSNGDGAVLLQLSKNDYVPFMDWLQLVSGVKWVDLAEQRENVLHQISQSKGRSFRVRLEDYAAGDKTHSTFRTYNVVPVDLHGELYLYVFKDEVRPPDLVGILPVEDQWSDNTCVREAAALFAKCEQNVGVEKPTVGRDLRPVHVLHVCEFLANAFPKSSPAASVVGFDSGSGPIA
jgi:hypothetical protein